MFQSNILRSVYIDEYISILDWCLIIISKIQPVKALIITIADDIYCKNLFYFGNKKTKQNQMKIIKKMFLLIVFTI